MEINLLELWNKMGLPVRAVVVVLTLQACASLAVIVDRLIMIGLSRLRSRTFAENASTMKVFDANELLTLTKKTKGSHLADFVSKGLAQYSDLVRSGHSAERATELTRRVLERKVEPLSRDLNRGMNVLASTGSTAPFVGLLGTVLGILQAFKMVGASGSSGLGAIGGAIAEALIVTGYGLTVAIPTVLLFNWMSAKLNNYEGDILNAAGDLLDRLELGRRSAEDAHAADARVHTREARVTSPAPRGA